MARVEASNTTVLLCTSAAILITEAQRWVEADGVDVGAARACDAECVRNCQSTLSHFSECRHGMLVAI